MTGSGIYTSAADAVMNALRRELLDGTIAAGSRILPKDVAKRFSLSVVPVREALKQLEAEGLVVTSPQRATYAAQIGLEDLAGVYDLRKVVEPEYACRSAIIANEEQRAACKAALAELIESEWHSPVFYEAHRNFHWSLLAPAASPILKSILERLWQNVDRYVALGANVKQHSAPDFIAAFNAEHQAIADAFLGRDQNQLRKLLIEHFVHTEATLRAVLRELTKA